MGFFYEFNFCFSKFCDFSKILYSFEYFAIFWKLSVLKIIFCLMLKISTLLNNRTVFNITKKKWNEAELVLSKTNICPSSAPSVCDMCMEIDEASQM